MKNLIFSIWSRPLTPNWIEYKLPLIDKQRLYADQCNVDYKHFDISLSFTELMFFKIQFPSRITSFCTIQDLSYKTYLKLIFN